MENKIEEIFDHIGKILSQNCPDNSLSTLLLVQIGDEFARINIFDDLGDNIIYRWPGNSNIDTINLGDLIFELQRVHNTSPPWCELDYFLQGDHFKAYFRYADEVDPERDTSNIRRDLLRPYFGERPVDYPPMPSVDGYDFSL